MGEPSQITNSRFPAMQQMGEELDAVQPVERLLSDQGVDFPCRRHSTHDREVVPCHLLTEDRRSRLARLFAGGGCELRRATCLPSQRSRQFAACFPSPNEQRAASLSIRTNCRREIVPASFTRGRQTRMIDDARAFVPELIIRLPSSVRMGHVPVIDRPEFNTASRKVSQPVLLVPSFSVSDCLNA